MTIPDCSRPVVASAVWGEIIAPTLGLFGEDLVQLLEIETIFHELVLEGFRGIDWDFLVLLLLREHLLVKLSRDGSGCVLISHFTRFACLWRLSAVVGS